MMKFFRKHNKKLLAVFMVLLMVVFVGGTALTELMSPRPNFTVAKSDLGNITDIQRQVANNTTSILASMGIDWQRPAPGVREPITLMDWILLSREASQLNKYSNDEAVRSWFGGATGEERVISVARRNRLKPSMIWEALKEYRTVQLVAQSMGAAWVPSTAEIRSSARKVLDKVQVNAVVLPASGFIADNEEFSDRELDEQFQNFRSAKPGDGLEFGYWVFDAVEVQYTKIDRSKLAELVGIANEEKKAKRYYDENRATDEAFRRPADDDTADGSATEDVADGAPPEPPKSPYLDWPEAKDAALAIVRDKVADDVAERMAVWLIDQASDAWMEMDRGEDRYRAIPPAAESLDVYKGLIANLPLSIAYPQAVSFGVTGAFTRDQASSVKEIGRASFQPARGARKNFAALAFRNQTVVGKIPEDAGASIDDYTARYQTSRYMLRDGDGNVFVFRVIGSVDEHAPETINEVRDQVIADLRVQHGYDSALARAEGLRSCEGGKTLKEAYDSDEELSIIADIIKTGALGFFESSPVPRLRFYEVGSGRATDTTYVGLGTQKVPHAFIEEWFAMEGDEPTVMEIPQEATVLVVEWSNTQRGDEAEYEEMRGRLASSLATKRSRDAISDWLDPDNIRARNGFELVSSR